MSEMAINSFLRELETLKHRGGTGNESTIRPAFHKLLSTYARARDLELVTELAMKGSGGATIKPDGTLKDNLRLDWGYWESKDEYDDLDSEIRKKFEKGYPNNNILFEDGNTAVLIRNGTEIARAEMRDPARLHEILMSFVSYERPEVKEFRKAIELFKEDIPKVTAALRESIVKNAEANKDYINARDSFLELCRDVINPAITPEDIREMVIQHILTADIFNTVFDEPYFHRENNIAQELEKLTDTFFTRAIRNKTLSSIKHYYDTINARAAQIHDHHEKQRFLKVVYENFYKSYNPKKADRLGVVYTPNEIVRFMIDSTDYLLQKHFGKMLEDPGVEILDPATGTGTFICDLIDHIRPHKLEHKYRHELHANEVEILPYYIANLNIEFTYKQKTGKYIEFENLCFVDTLDNYVNMSEGAEMDIFSLTDENADRIKRQNEKKISVIIGNPSYNANQLNENENNKNREYPAIDKRIRDTFIKASTAQKTKLYDMYARFYRWAMDRLDENGIIAFITNRSFINSRTFDGFRKILREEFDHAYIIDTKSDVRQNPKIAGTTHNVFGIQTGVAIMFLVKKESEEKHPCRISYYALEDEWRKEDKLQWLTEKRIDSIPFKNITPDKDNNWIDLVVNDWEELIPLSTKSKQGQDSQRTILGITSLGVLSARDEWVYDFNRVSLENKVKYWIDNYNMILSGEKINSDEIKWTRAVKRDLMQQRKYIYSPMNVVKCAYRPFLVYYLYYSQELNEMRYQLPHIFPTGNESIPIIAYNWSATKPFSCYAINKICDYHFLGDTQCLPIYRYSSDGTRHDNITDWALTEFQTHYQDASITKKDIFHYVYGVLHDPHYRAKYEINLKRSLPRIPFKADFWLWANWGKELMGLHLNFETVEPWPLNLQLIDDPDAVPKVRLKADRDRGTITLTDHRVLTGIPPQAWNYKLGNRSALDWILDQYKEKKPKDPTIAKLFDTYRFTDYQDKVTDLLARVCAVSMKTMGIVENMAQLAD